MQIEQKYPNQPKFLLVVYMSAFAVVLIVLAAIIVIGWRNHKGHNKPPFTKTPVSVVAPAPRLSHPEPFGSFRLRESGQAA